MIVVIRKRQIGNAWGVTANRLSRFLLGADMTLSRLGGFFRPVIRDEADRISARALLAYEIAQSEHRREIADTLSRGDRPGFARGSLVCLVFIMPELIFM